METNDKELLEKAAKAAGIDVRWIEACKDFYEHRPHMLPSYWDKWNPLTDDGDALRLAVNLNIEFACFDDMEQVNAGVWSPGPESWDCMTPYNGDKQAATRRAITRAAAACAAMN